MWRDRLVSPYLSAESLSHVHSSVGNAHSSVRGENRHDGPIITAIRKIPLDRNRSDTLLVPPIFLKKIKLSKWIGKYSSTSINDDLAFDKIVVTSHVYFSLNKQLMHVSERIFLSLKRSLNVRR